MVVDLYFLELTFQHEQFVPLLILYVDHNVDHKV